MTVVIILCLIAYYILRKIRDGSNLENTTSDHLSNFREMKQRGVLDDKEFRIIKTTLSEKMSDELDDADA